VLPLCLSDYLLVGLGVTCASLVGNALGADRKRLAIQMGRLSLSYCLALLLCLSLLILMFGSRFVSIFSSDPEVHAIASGVVPYLSLFLLFDGMQGKYLTSAMAFKNVVYLKNLLLMLCVTAVSSGVLRGAGT